MTFTPRAPNEIIAALRGGPPANAADLRELVVDRLQRIGEERTTRPPRVSRSILCCGSAHSAPLDSGRQTPEDIEGTPRSGARQPHAQRRPSGHGPSDGRNPSTSCDAVVGLARTRRRSACLHRAASTGRRWMRIERQRALTRFNANRSVSPSRGDHGPDSGPYSPCPPCRSRENGHTFSC